MSKLLNLLLPLTLLIGCSFESDAALMSQQQLLDAINAGEHILILDVRTPGEFEEGHIPGATHIDHRDIDARLHEIDSYKESAVVVYCLSGMRAAMVESTLIDAGFRQVFHLQGDWSSWREADLPYSIKGKRP